MRELKTIAALILCFVLLTASAMAQGTEFRLNNIILQIEDYNMDLSGIDLVVDFGEDQGTSGAFMAIDTAAARIADIAAAIEGEDLIFTSSGLSKSYKLNIADAMQSANFTAADIDFNNLISGFGEEDIEKLNMLVMQAVAIAQDSIQDGGMVEYEGASYQKVDFAFSDEQIHSLLYAGADILDAHPEIAQITGIENLHSALESAEFEVEISGSVYINDAGMIMDIYLNSAESVLLHFDYTTESKEQNNEMKILFEFYVGDQEDEEYPMDFEISGNIVLKNDVFSSFEIFVGESDEEGDEGAYIKYYASESQGKEKAELIIETADGNTRIDTIVCPNDDGTDEVEIILTTGESSIDLKANISTTEAADGWMPAAKECVDILNLSEEDISALENEGMLILFTAIGQLGHANSSIGNLISDNILG